MTAPRGRRGCRTLTSSTLPSSPTTPAMRSASAAPRRLALGEAVDRGPPRALAGAGRPFAEQRLDERAGARMEATALHRRERVAHELLDARERPAELLDVALDERGQQRREDELRDLRRALGRRHEPPERLLLGRPRQPGLGPGTTSTTRHSSGIGWWASSGAGRSSPRRTPPSTTRPPSANVHVPTAERAARPTASASSGAPTVRSSSAASACATASASFVPDPSPTCGGIASTTRTCAPPASPSASWQRRANASARSASAPSADSSSAGCASTTTAGRTTATPSPPKRRGPSPATASIPRCSRAGASTRTPRHSSPYRRAQVAP